MLETNVRIVFPGRDLFIMVRRAHVAGPNLTDDLLQDACGVLRNRHGLAAVPADANSLWVATRREVPQIHLEAGAWEIDVADAGESPQRLTLRDANGLEILPQLVERAMSATIARLGGLWRHDSPRIWYEDEPFQICDGISAYRRYEIGALPIDDVGVGMAVDVGVAFFSRDTLADFFNPALPPTERQRREEAFDRWTARQVGQKGTLLYDNGLSRVTCYFVDAPSGATCGATGTIRVRGESFPSLLAYYQAKNPHLPVTAESPAVRVSFRGLERPQWVAAERVRVRIANDVLPERLASVDKIAPAGRRRMVCNLWDRLGPRPFGDVAPGVCDGFWQPSPDQIVRATPPTILFGNGMVLEGTDSASREAYSESYRERAALLDHAGCYAVPATLPHVVHLAYPQALEDGILGQLAEALKIDLAGLTGREIIVESVPYATIEDVVTKLRRYAAGAALVILNDEPSAYHDVAFGLPAWRIKRLTEHTLLEQHAALEYGIRDSRTQTFNRRKGRGRWRQFICLVVLDLLQLHDVIPFRLADSGPFEAHLAIDVGHSRSHVSLSLFISRNESSRPAFSIVTQTHRKADPQHETINPRLLRDDLIRLVRDALESNPTPLNSLLVLRDGRWCGIEAKVVDDACAALKTDGLISATARIDLVEIHKSSLKPIRLWERDANGRVENPTEGTMVLLGPKMAMVTTTGAATLHQGTAAPLLLVGNGRCSSISESGCAVIASAQHNWSSPGMGQRLPLELERTDEELNAHAAREVRRID